MTEIELNLWIFCRAFQCQGIFIHVLPCFVPLEVRCRLTFVGRSCGATDISYHNPRPIPGQVLHRPQQGAHPFVGIVCQRDEHRALCTRGALLLVPLVARRRAEAALGAPERLVVAVVPLHCRLLRLRRWKGRVRTVLVLKFDYYSVSAQYT